MKPVYLCGRGLACGLGLDLAEALSALHSGQARVAAMTLPGESGGSFPFHAIPSQLDDWNERARSLVERVAKQAGMPPRNSALFVATSSYDIGAAELHATKRNYAAFADKVAGWLQWTGPVHVINTACTSSLNALIAAHALLREGDAQEALVLGIELDNRLTVAGFAALQLLSQVASHPFGAHRDGLVLGEAVSALRLSTQEAASWKMLGGANVVDGTQPTGASAAAIERMYQRALRASGLDAQSIDLVKVQAAGSPGNDAIEAQGLRDTFQTLPALVSFKGVMGHTMGASGAAEIALLTACLEQGVWPRYDYAVDETLRVELVAQQPPSVRHVMATILGFGGSHATVILERT